MCSAHDLKTEASPAGDAQDHNAIGCFCPYCCCPSCQLTTLDDASCRRRCRRTARGTCWQTMMPNSPTMTTSAAPAPHPRCVLLQWMCMHVSLQRYWQLQVVLAVAEAGQQLFVCLGHSCLPSRLLLIWFCLAFLLAGVCSAAGAADAVAGQRRQARRQRFVPGARPPRSCQGGCGMSHIWRKHQASAARCRGEAQPRDGGSAAAMALARQH